LVNDASLSHLTKLFDDPDGFLVELHIWGKFNIEKYTALISAIRDYVEFLGDKDDINRHIAGCLHIFIGEIETALANDIKEPNNHERILRDAHAEVLDLVLKALRP
jgi:hypothetical protein